jgi:hypothetical protein
LDIVFLNYDGTPGRFRALAISKSELKTCDPKRVTSFESVKWYATMDYFSNFEHGFEVEMMLIHKFADRLTT